MRRTTPESEVLKGCTDLLTAEGVWWERRNTGAMTGEYNGKKRFTRFGKPGVADIQVLINVASCRPYDSTARTYFLHRVIWVECKTQTGRQTQAQKHFQREVEADGQTYLLVRSVDELRDWLREHAR